MKKTSIWLVMIVASSSYAYVSDYDMDWYEVYIAEKKISYFKSCSFFVEKKPSYMCFGNKCGTDDLIISGEVHGCQVDGIIHLYRDQTQTEFEDEIKNAGFRLYKNMSYKLMDVTEV